jgi:hypothetical protein
VLTAFQEVEDDLAAVRILEQEAVEQYATSSAKSPCKSLMPGTSADGPDLQVITAQTTALTNERNDLSTSCADAWMPAFC